MKTAMNTMTFKDYAAHINYSDEDACFIGHIAGITDVIRFHADNVTDLRHASGRVFSCHFFGLACCCCHQCPAEPAAFTSAGGSSKLRFCAIVL